CTHLLLPSFPTRRSSDLDVARTNFVAVDLGHIAIPEWDVSRVGVFRRPQDHKTGREAREAASDCLRQPGRSAQPVCPGDRFLARSEEHTSELQSRENLVC